MRDATGHATVRAIKLTAPLTVDGRLDEEVYRRALPFGGLLQVVPRYGEEMTERTDLWITYDQKYIYVSCRCWSDHLGMGYAGDANQRSTQRA